MFHEILNYNVLDFHDNITVRKYFMQYCLQIYCYALIIYNINLYYIHEMEDSSYRKGQF